MPTATQLCLATMPLPQDNSRHTINGLCGEIDHFRSRYHPGPPEGMILRQDDSQWCQALSKLVPPDVTQAIKNIGAPGRSNGMASSLALTRSLHQ
jgi:hypothetical protein